MRAHLSKILALTCVAAALAPSLARQGEKAKKAWEGTW